MQEQVGMTAGEIYKFLTENDGEASLSKIKKGINAKGSFAEMALGWLMREDKVETYKKGLALNVKLK